MRTPATSAMQGGASTNVRAAASARQHKNTIPLARIYCPYANICLHVLQITCLVLQRGRMTRTNTDDTLTDACQPASHLAAAASIVWLVYAHSLYLKYQYCCARERGAHTAGVRLRACASQRFFLVLAHAHFHDMIIIALDSTKCLKIDSIISSTMASTGEVLPSPACKKARNGALAAIRPRSRLAHTSWRTSFCLFKLSKQNSRILQTCHRQLLLVLVILAGVSQMASVACQICCRVKRCQRITRAAHSHLVI